MSTILRPSLQAQAFTDRWQVEIVDLTATYRRNAGMKSAAILDGDSCRLTSLSSYSWRTPALPMAVALGASCRHDAVKTGALIIISRHSAASRPALVT